MCVCEKEIEGDREREIFKYLQTNKTEHISGVPRGRGKIGMVMEYIYINIQNVGLNTIKTTYPNYRIHRQSY